MESPVILLTFSNSQDDYLKMLKRESKSIMRALELMESKQLIRLAREESADLDSVFHDFNRFKDEIVIFHYAGHAGGDNLQFEDGAGQAAGLANLFGQQKNLKLVFLNGCSTKPQVDKLMEYGVPAVIATSVAIQDGKAVEFAEQFYRAMANKSTIKAAFHFAASWLQAKYKDIKVPEIIENYRSGFGFSHAPAAQAELPWGLYLNSDKNVLDWTLPTQFTQKIARTDLGHDFAVNDYIYNILDDMLAADPELNDKLTDSEGIELDDRNLLALIIGNYPWSIGSQLRRLVSRDEGMNNLAITRLQQIVNTYVIASQVLFYIAIAQIWGEKRRLGGTFPVGSHYLDALSILEGNFKSFDYLAQVNQIVKEFEEYKIPFFVKEFRYFLTAFEEKGDFFNAYLYLESLRSRLIDGNSNIAEREMPQLCADSEYCLSVVIGKMAFLINYQMLTVRDIIINKAPHREPEFQHIMGNLKAQDNDFLSLFKDPKPYDKFMDSRSVILVKDLRDVSTYLNLSPFIVDKNAYGDVRATSTDLFMYGFCQNDNFTYFSIRHNVFKPAPNDGDVINTNLEERSEAQVQRVSRLRSRGAATQDVKRPYEMLKTQFLQFKDDVAK